MGLMGLMGLTDLGLILLVRVVSTVAGLITALESPAMGTTPRTGLILSRLLLTGRSLISPTLLLSASVRRRRLTMVITHLHHHITVITRLHLRLHLLTVLTHRRRRRHHHHHHTAISRRLPSPASALLRPRPRPRPTTADSGRASSVSSTHMDPRRRCPGNIQIGSTRLRTVIRTMGTDTDMREDHLVWGMRVTTALLTKITGNHTVTTKATRTPMSPSGWTDPSTRAMRTTSHPMISKNLRPRPTSRNLAGKTGIYQ